MLAQAPPFRWSVDDYDRIIAHGILKEDQRVELIRGEIVPKMPIGDLHIACVDNLSQFMFQAVGITAVVSIQNPIRLSDSEPEPDLVLKRRKNIAYGKPGPPDLFLVVEVAETSLETDRSIKAPIYAENGITEYWIVNLIDRCLEVHRDPRPDGTYGDVQTLRAGDSVNLVALPGVTVAVTDLF